jgi:hypothetical protein
MQAIVKGFVDTRKLTMQNIVGTRNEFEQEGLKFPTNEELDFDIGSDWVVLLNPCAVFVHVEVKKGENYWLEFDFKRGYVWDLCSVPKAFRSIVDNDSAEGIVAGMVHDYCFTSHCLSFRDSNSVFRGLLLVAGASRFKSLIYFGAVSSPVGKFLYKNKTVKRAIFQLGFCDFIKTRCE